MKSQWLSFDDAKEAHAAGWRTEREMRAAGWQIFPSPTDEEWGRLGAIKIDGGLQTLYSQEVILAAPDAIFDLFLLDEEAYGMWQEGCRLWLAELA
jgi:hypothetical protein